MAPLASAMCGGALIGNKRVTQGQAKCVYGTQGGVFLLFCTGNDIMYSNHGLGTVRKL